MKCLPWILISALLTVAVVFLLWQPASPVAPAVSAGDGDSPAEGAVLRLGLIPERDILDHRRRYRALAAHLQRRLARPVELVTMSTYSGVLTDLAEQRIDAAFLGSLVTVLAYERHGARVVAKPEYVNGDSSYHGVIFTREDSPLQSLSELAPTECVAMVRATLAGHLFPASLLLEANRLTGPGAIRICWVGSHDEIIAAIAERRIVIGAAKNLRIDAYERDHPDTRFRRLARSGEVPENALVLAAQTSVELEQELKAILLAMPDDAEGQTVLRQMDIRRFVPCDIADYGVVYDFVRQLAPHWDHLGIQGPAPEAPPDAARRPE